MKLLKNSFICLFITLFLTGCWDQSLLKDVKLVIGLGFDLTHDGKLLETIATPLFSAGTESEPTQSQITSAIGNTTRDARNTINNEVAERFDSSKLMIILFGKDYAKTDIYPALDSFYTDPKSSLVATAAIVDGKASELLRVKTKEKKTMSTYLAELIESSQAATVVPKLKGLMLSHIYNPGQDLVLPLLHVKQDKVQVKGLAMFNGPKYTGQHLQREDSTLYILMNDGQIGKEASINLKIHQNKKTRTRNYITINVVKSKRKIKVDTTNPKQISVNLLLNLKVEITEYPQDHLDTEKRLNKLNKDVSLALTTKANHVLKKSQTANSDILGIGRHIIAFHNDTWRKITWKQIYPHLNMRTNVHVDIVKHGVFN